jgi:hypothetical protein
MPQHIVLDTTLQYIILGYTGVAICLALFVIGIDFSAYGRTLENRKMLEGPLLNLRLMLKDLDNPNTSVENKREIIERMREPFEIIRNFQIVLDETDGGLQSELKRGFTLLARTKRLINNARR